MPNIFYISEVFKEVAQGPTDFGIYDKNKAASPQGMTAVVLKEHLAESLVKMDHILIIYIL